LHYEEIQQVLKTLLYDFLGDQTDPNKVEEVTHTSEMAKKAKQLQKVCVCVCVCYACVYVCDKIKNTKMHSLVVIKYLISSCSS